MSSRALLFCVSGLCVTSASACLSATQVTFDVSTDIPCAQIKATSVTVGLEGETELADPATISMQCTSDDTVGAIGTYALSPKPGFTGNASIKIVQAVADGIAVDTDCTRAKGYLGCVVARRRVSFLKHHSLVVPVRMFLVCRDVACDPSSTCNRAGRCVNSQVDLEKCVDDVCETLVEGDGPNDAGAGIDAGTIDGGSTDAGFADAGPSLEDGGPPLRNIVQISASGGTHACARLANGGVVCWGANNYTQLGAASGGHPVPANGASSDIAHVEAASAFTFAITTSGALKAWGHGNLGQLGWGASGDKAVATPVQGLDSGVTHVAGGRSHSCASLQSGDLMCWGQNQYGETGRAGVGNLYAPALVAGFHADITSLSAAQYFTCATTDGGTAWCWGLNADGQLGTGSSGNATTPTPVQGLSAPAVSIATGGQHTCALLSTGSVQCWGANTHSQLGSGNLNASPVPVDVQGLTSGVRELSVGLDHACALMADTTVKCWGWNAYGQLGNDSVIDSPVPVAVIGLSGVTHIATSIRNSCALLSNGLAMCWGDNTQAELGIGTSDGEAHVPVYVRE